MWNHVQNIFENVRNNYYTKITAPNVFGRLGQKE